MEFLLFVAAICGLVWMMWYVPRGSLVAGAFAAVIAVAVFGFAFWHTSGGPAPISIDRLVLILLAITYAWRRLRGTAEPKPLLGADWVLFALLGVLAASTFTHDWHFQNGQALAHLVIYWLTPAAIYWVARQSPLNERNVTAVIAALAVFGVYLTLTALAEGSGQWWAVFPGYISSPTHEFYGRARGPFLNPAGLGIYLPAVLAASLCCWNRVGRSGKLLLMGFAALNIGALFATLTRSVWMGGALSGTIFLSFALPRQWRNSLIGTGAVMLIALVATQWDSLWNLKRDENLSASASADSAELRPIFANVAWNMFMDRPLLGCGYGQYDREKLPYLADRSGDLPLEKARPYVQHNAFLALLTETGLVGTGLFVLLVILWSRNAWVLWSDRSGPSGTRQMGLLFMATVGAYFPNAMFHDTNIIDGVNVLIFFLAGLTSGLVAQRHVAEAGAMPRWETGEHYSRRMLARA